MNMQAQTIAKDNDGGSIFKFILGELKPKGRILTPFNIIAIPIILPGIVLIDQPLSELPEEVWQDFQHSFLGTKPKYPHFRGLEKSGYGPEYFQ